jgi:hypothetical protein
VVVPAATHRASSAPTPVSEQQPSPVPTQNRKSEWLDTLLGWVVVIIILYLFSLFK